MILSFRTMPTLRRADPRCNACAVGAHKLNPCAGASGLAGARLAPELNDQPQLALAQDRLDRADDSGLPGDLDPLADLEWLLVAEVAGRDDLVAATQLIAIFERRHRTRPRYARQATAPTRRVAGRVETSRFASESPSPHRVNLVLTPWGAQTRSACE
jgi:hypothetical protein